MGIVDEPGLKQRHRVTVEQYYRMADAGALPPDARVELIEGEVLDMAPMGSALASAVRRLDRLLQQAIGERAIVSCQLPLRLGEHSEPQPDLMLLRPRADDYRSAHPGAADVLLVVEIADTTLEYDRRVKVPLYARHGVPEVWIVDLANRMLRLYRRPSGESYADITATETPGAVAVLALPGVSLDLRHVL